MALTGSPICTPSDIKNLPTSLRITLPGEIREFNKAHISQMNLFKLEGTNKHKLIFNPYDNLMKEHDSIAILRIVTTIEREQFNQVGAEGPRFETTRSHTHTILIHYDSEVLATKKGDINATWEALTSNLFPTA